jgi:DNA-binding MarR family transcriptional regulator
MKNGGVTPELQYGLVEVLTRLVRGVRERLPRDVGGRLLSPEQTDVILILNRVASPLTMSEVAATRSIAINSASAAVDRLAAAGLVKRIAGKEDGRVVRVALTASGKAASVRLRAARLKEFERLLKQLGEDDLTRLIDAIPVMSLLADSIWSVKESR